MLVLVVGLVPILAALIGTETTPTSAPAEILQNPVKYSHNEHTRGCRRRPTYDQVIRWVRPRVRGTICMYRAVTCVRLFEERS